LVLFFGLSYYLSDLSWFFYKKGIIYDFLQYFIRHYCRPSYSTYLALLSYEAEISAPWYRLHSRVWSACPAAAQWPAITPPPPPRNIDFSWKKKGGRAGGRGIERQKESRGEMRKIDEEKHVTNKWLAEGREGWQRM
jgi:hypothetical protein